MPLTETDCNVIQELFDNSQRNQAQEYAALLEEVRDELRACRKRESSLSWIRTWLMMFRLKLGKAEFEVSLAGVLTILGFIVFANHFNF